MTTPLLVDLDTLPNLSKMLERLGYHADTGRRYVRKNSVLSGGEGWLNQLSGAHGSVVDHTTEWLSEVHDPTAVGSAEAVDETIEHYRVTDADTAAQLDEAVGPFDSLLDRPNPGTDYYVRTAGVAGFGDTGDPEDSYQPPPDYNNDEAYRYNPQWYDVVSPASIGRDAIWFATDFLASIGWLDRPYDPYEYALKPVVGDWAAFRGCADVFRNLADAVGTMGGNLYHAQYSMPTAWLGNAADACNVHLNRIRTKLYEAQPPLLAIADQYEEASLGQADFRSAVGQMISDLIDFAIALGITIAAGTATSWTGVGAVVATLVGVVEAGAIVNIIIQFIDLYARVDAAIALIESAMNDFGQLQASDFYLPRMPEVTGGHSTLDSLPS